MVIEPSLEATWQRVLHASSNCAISLGVDNDIEHRMCTLNAEADEIKMIFGSGRYDCAVVRAKTTAWQAGACACLDDAAQQTTGTLRSELDTIRELFGLDYDLCEEGVEEHWSALFDKKRLGLKRATELISDNTITPHGGIR